MCPIFGRSQVLRNEGGGDDCTVFTGDARGDKAPQGDGFPNGAGKVSGEERWGVDSSLNHNLQLDNGLSGKDASQ